MNAPVDIGLPGYRHWRRRPAEGTPERVPGSVRRTVTTDMLRPEGLQGMLVLVGRGRDLRTGDGGVTVLGEARMRAEVDFGRNELRGLWTEPERPALRQVTGTPAGSGFRRRVLAADPDLPAACGLLHQLLDDVPVTMLVSGYSWATQMLLHGTGDLSGHPPMFGRDNCAGFADGGTMMTAVDATGQSPMPAGPAAPSLLTADPWAWHPLEPLPPLGMRRARRTDVRPGRDQQADVLFRDSYVRSDGCETVIHEYTVAVDIDGPSGVIRSIRATPQVLPWVECPAAAASAQRLVGAPLAGLRTLVRETFTGVTTCTHLNDTLRSLEDVPELLAQAERAA